MVVSIALKDLTEDIKDLKCQLEEEEECGEIETTFELAYKLADLQRLKNYCLKTGKEPVFYNGKWSVK